MGTSIPWNVVLSAEIASTNKQKLCLHSSGLYFQEAVLLLEEFNCQHGYGSK